MLYEQWEKDQEEIDAEWASASQPDFPCPICKHGAVKSSSSAFVFSQDSDDQRLCCDRTGCTFNAIEGLDRFDEETMREVMAHSLQGYSSLPCNAIHLLIFVVESVIATGTRRRHRRSRANE